jgi:CBS domain-containing protein
MRHGVITVSPGERVSRVMQLMTPRAAKLKSTHFAHLPVESFRSGLIALFHG